MRALWKPILRKKSLTITKLFNLEICVILAPIGFNLKLNNPYTLEIFDNVGES